MQTVQKSTWDEGFHHFFPDPTPIELPIGYEAPESLAEMIARMIRAEDYRKMSEAAGVESFDEADDFEMEEDEFKSEHEMSQMQEEYYVPPVSEKMEGEEKPQAPKDHEVNVDEGKKHAKDEAPPKVVAVT
ncbi:hypothetical protein [Microviridae sp.]|nr:hypothetical protein [Microviridae sp.]